MGQRSALAYLSESVSHSVDSAYDFRDSSLAAILAAGAGNSFSTVLHSVELSTVDWTVGLALETESLIIGHANQPVDWTYEYEYSAIPASVKLLF